jgi:hypothetical protein
MLHSNQANAFNQQVYILKFKMIGLCINLATVPSLEHPEVVDRIAEKFVIIIRPDFL